MSPELRGIDVARRLGAALLYLVFGGVFLVPMAGVGWGTLTSMRWREVPCVIVQSGVETQEPTEPDGQTLYRFAVRYRYEVDGQSYEGDRFHFTNAFVDDSRSADMASLAYPPGEHVECWVHPKDPRQAVLVRGSTPLMLIVLIPAALVLFGILRLSALAGDLVQARAERSA